MSDKEAKDFLPPYFRLVSDTTFQEDLPHSFPLDSEFRKED